MVRKLSEWEKFGLGAFVFLCVLLICLVAYTIIFWNSEATNEVLTNCVAVDHNIRYMPNGALYPPPPTNLISLFAFPNVYVIYFCDGEQRAALGYDEDKTDFSNLPPVDMEDRPLYYVEERGLFSKTRAVIATLETYRYPVDRGATVTLALASVIGLGCIVFLVIWVVNPGGKWREHTVSRPNEDEEQPCDSERQMVVFSSSFSNSTPQAAPPPALQTAPPALSRIRPQPISVS